MSSLAGALPGQQQHLQRYASHAVFIQCRPYCWQLGRCEYALAALGCIALYTVARISRHQLLLDRPTEDRTRCRAHLISKTSAAMRPMAVRTSLRVIELSASLPQRGNR